MNRCLPIYLLVDCSESMVGEPLDAVNRGIEQLCVDLRGNPMALETVGISVVFFSSKARQIVPLTEIIQFRAPKLEVGPGTGLGAAFDVLRNCIDREVKKSTATQKGDWKPMVFLLTDGIPTDDWQQAWQRCKPEFAKRGVNLIAVACGDDADLGILQSITPTVLVMKNVTSGSFSEFFKWVSASVSTVSVHAQQEGRGVQLPNLPAAALEVAPTGAGTGGKKAPTQLILAARCKNTGKGYLMRYKVRNGSYTAEGAYPVSEDYFAEAMASRGGETIDASKFSDAPACPHCRRPAWTVQSDHRSLVCSDTLVRGGGKAQIVFVLDVTGSMAGEIAGVKKNIAAFMDRIRSEGLSVEAGLVAFRDLECGEPPEVFGFGASHFTADPAAFKAKVTGLRAVGGGSNPGESGFDGMAKACRLFRDPGVTRILIHITDEPPLLPDGEIQTLEDLFGIFKSSKIDQLHFVVPDVLTPLYELFHQIVKGKMFRLKRGVLGRGDSFDDVLMDIGKSISIMAREG